MNNSKVIRNFVDHLLKDTGIIILRRVQRALFFEGQWKFKLVSKEDNTIADHMAKVGLTWKSNF